MLWSREMQVGLVVAVALLSPSPGAALVDLAEREQAASEVADTFLEELSVAVASEMSKGGPIEAIVIWPKLASDIAGRLSREHGWRVTRVGTRVRDPLLGMPDVWEQKVLAEFAERAAKGETLPGMVYSEVVTEPSGQYYRYMRSIVMQPKCLVCHGSNEQIPDVIKTALKKQYPFDAATGYKAGELRGAVSIKQPLGGRDR